ncbi:hypothetical protein FACS1894177_06400 [Bacteroidia bacterium]|nr:hypothetical protein FACS1894177_06400 [Bacteroidia bacterium]
MQTLIDKEHTRLVKKFHILLGRYGIDNDTKMTLLLQYNATSSVYLTSAQLLELCDLIERANNPVMMELDKCRKRLIASIGGWLRSMSRIENMQIIKAIACRASGKKSFNDIPIEQLRSLYNAFNKKRKDLQMVENLTIEELKRLTLMN